MERRNFVRLIGASMASLLVTNYLKAENRSTNFIQMPDDVMVLLDGEYFPLRSSDRHSWSYRDIVVTLKEGKQGIAVSIYSPTQPVKEVRLSWKYSTPSAVRILGDAWERTYGDIGFRSLNATGSLPWYCVEHNAGNTVCFGVRTGGGTFCYWRVEAHKLHLNIDTRNGGGGVLLGERTLQAAQIVTTKNEGNENAFATVRRFCRLMCDKPRAVKQPVYGINDWYFAYGNNSADLILKHTALLSPLATNVSNRPFSVIDDGWSVGSDYTRTNEKFPDMPKLVDKIGKLGMRSGLWTRPLLAKPGLKENLFIPQHGQVLDPTIGENIAYIEDMFRLYKDWGFEMIKHDYTTFEIFTRYGMDMGGSMTFPGWHFNDRSKTNAEIILDLYKSIRNASGDTYLIGCNTVSHLSAGLFELYRTGDDTSGKEWGRTKKMGVNTLGFRMPQHRTFYEADGDCVGLTTQIPWEKNKQWMKLLAESSTPLFISAQPEAVGEEQKRFIRSCFDAASSSLPVAEPLDWLENDFPSKWKLNDKLVEFDWD